MGQSQVEWLAYLKYEIVSTDEKEEIVSVEIEREDLNLMIEVLNEMGYDELYVDKTEKEKVLLIFLFCRSW